jgi:predicted Zn-dependent protease
MNLIFPANHLKRISQLLSRIPLMKKIISILITGIFIFIHCQPVPITKRRQLDLVPQAQMVSLGIQSYQQVKDSLKTVTGTPQAQEVATVAKNITNAVITYLDQHKLSDRVKDFKWQYNLFEDTAVNAWAMPGGGIGVFTGILPYTKNDTGLAVVLGHEIAHVIAQHGDERMSQMLLVNMGGLGLSTALSTKPELTQKFAMAAFGLGTQVGVLLPYSRLQESEADHLGLIFMAMAGYDPHAAIPFWERMSNASKGPEVPEFLSTHPNDKKRIQNLEKLIPEAMKQYKPK